MSNGLGIDFEALDMKYGLPQGTSRAVAQTESNMNPRAVSPAGAQGLMQFMPGTARDMGLTDPFDASASADAGARYLSQLMNRYGGNMTKALQAYNFGMGNIDRGRPLPAETQAYAPKVQGHRLQFIGDELFSGGDRLGSIEAELFGDAVQPADRLGAIESELFGDAGLSGAGQSPEDVPMPGAPEEYIAEEKTYLGKPALGGLPVFQNRTQDALLAAVKDSRDKGSPAYLQVVPPGHRGAVESMVHKGSTPLRALGELASAAIPDVLERKMTSTGQTYLEHQKEVEESYQKRRHDPEAPDYIGMTSQLATTLPLAFVPITSPTAGGIGGMLGRLGANAARGAIGAVAQPTEELTGEGVAKEKAKQLGIGAAVGAGAPVVGKAAAIATGVPLIKKAKRLYDLTRVQKADRTVRQAQQAAKDAVAQSRAKVAAAEKEGEAVLQGYRDKITQEEQKLINTQRALDRLTEVARQRTGAAQAEAQKAADAAKAQVEASKKAIADMQRREKKEMTSLKRSIIATKARQKEKVDKAMQSLQKSEDKKANVNQIMKLRMEEALQKKASAAAKPPARETAEVTVKASAGKALKETAKEVEEDFLMEEVENLLLMKKRNAPTRR